MQLDLPNSVAVITGAGGGFGRALASSLAQRGWHIVVADIDAEGAAETVAIVEARGGTARSVSCDTSSEPDVTRLAEGVFELEGACHLLINNAGVGTAGAVGVGSLDHWRRCLDINLRGPVYGCHLFLPRMLQQERGHILNVASLAAFATPPKMGAYNISKSGVVALSETLAGELSDSSISVSVACPSFFQTNIGEAMQSDDEDSNRAGRVLVERSKTTAEQVAERVLSGVRRGEFLHLPQVDSKLMWRAKRWVPSIATRAIAFGAKLTSR